MLRLIHSKRGGRFVGAGSRFEFAAGWTPAGGTGIRLVHADGIHLAALSYGDSGEWAVPAGVEAATPNDVCSAAWELLGK